ncbi:DUF3592 domain-containing protein [Solitalea canadensis]|uniref:DUF3592 domain-containing protein n=1 Tax=Solitalea canadensis (strain ATCC 29591 / DSM 3403 / JCM 21819 / LMG 8368 / NBRC 15130 / NCIMB 12057 / USAM 9D) TaxID=929556 RepID=H8KW48_SOLCM|nr:DUF3592 domain-containing protein [Solitalea canadensis]AFD07069.1 Protein of unknown function (DUF3592) [Solitalea canadensis DSM 3403]
MTELYPYVSFFIGTTLLLYTLFYQFKSDELIKTGISVEGIIFTVEEINSFNTHKTYYQDITVRFLTIDNEWITAKYNPDLQLSYSGQYFIGEKISIKYNQENPQEFIILSKQSNKLSKIGLATIGVILMSYGIYLYLYS